MSLQVKHIDIDGSDLDKSMQRHEMFPDNV